MPELPHGYAPKTVVNAASSTGTSSDFFPEWEQTRAEVAISGTATVTFRGTMSGTKRDISSVSTSGLYLVDSYPAMDVDYTISSGTVTVIVWPVQR